MPIITAKGAWRSDMIDANNASGVGTSFDYIILYGALINEVMRLEALQLKFEYKDPVPASGIDHLRAQVKLMKHGVPAQQALFEAWGPKAAE